MVAALLTRMSRPPKRSIARGDAGVGGVDVTGVGGVDGDLPLTSLAAAASSVSCLREDQHHPGAGRRLISAVIARPIPRDVPVTSVETFLIESELHEAGGPYSIIELEPVADLFEDAAVERQPGKLAIEIARPAALCRQVSAGWVCRYFREGVHQIPPDKARNAFRRVARCNPPCEREWGLFHSCDERW